MGKRLFLADPLVIVDFAVRLGEIAATQGLVYHMAQPLEEDVCYLVGDEVGEDSTIVAARFALADRYARNAFLKQRAHTSSGIAADVSRPDPLGGVRYDCLELP